MNFILLQAQAPTPNPWSTWGMLLLIIVIFYFFMIRPQMKRQKALRKFQDELAKGDRVLVSGGIFGKVYDIKEDSIIVEIAHETRIRVLKSSVFRDSTDVEANAQENKSK